MHGAVPPMQDADGQEFEPIDLETSHRSAVQSLAERSRSPLELVERMYRRELAQLASHARVTQYLPLLASRRVRDLLRHSHASGSSSR